MDSKIVNTLIRRNIRPLLKEAGFARSTARTYWRHSPDKIDVVNFQSFNAYLADRVGCTTYSFAVNLGCYFTVVPDPAPRVTSKDGFLLPSEDQCHFRRQLHKSLPQPELSRTDIWYIDSNGSYLESAIHDARLALRRDAFPWFERFSSLREVLRTLLEDDESMSETWGFGRNPSPVRQYMTGYLALCLGETELAANHLARALQTGPFEQARERILRDLNLLGQSH